MIRILNSSLAGMLLFLLLDFVFFAGLKGSYFNTLGINEVFNSIFMDNQSLLLFLILIIPIGYLFIYSKIFQIFYLTALITFSTMFIEDIGYMVGEILFVQKGTISLKGIESEVRIYYVGREFVYYREFENDVIQKKRIEN